MPNLIERYCGEFFTCPKCGEKAVLYHASANYITWTDLWEYTATQCMLCIKKELIAMSKTPRTAKTTHDTKFRKILRADEIIRDPAGGSTFLSIHHYSR